MRLRDHGTLLLVGVIAWLMFYVIGLPSNYFMAWSLEGKILLSFVAFFGAVPLVGGLAILFLGGDMVKTGWWTAFYFSAPLFFLDYLVVGWHQGEGLDFLKSHWYLTGAYIYVWVELPVIGLALRKLRNHADPK